MWGKTMTNKKAKSRITENDKKIGLELRVLRRKAKMSQSALGQALDLTFQQIQKYEKGSNRISALRLYQISKIFDVEIDHFFKCVDIPYSQQLKTYKQNQPIQKFKGVLPEKKLRFELSIFDQATSSTQTLV